MQSVHNYFYYYGHSCQQLSEPEQLLAEMAFRVDSETAFMNQLSGILSLPLLPHRCPLSKVSGSEVVTESYRAFWQNRLFTSAAPLMLTRSVSDRANAQVR